MRLELERPPSAADAQRHPSARELVDGGHLFGDPQWIVDGELEDAGAHAQRRRARGDRHHEGERITLVARHEVVMTDGDGVEARFFGDASELEALPERIAMAGLAKDGE